MPGLMDVVIIFTAAKIRWKIRMCGRWCAGIVITRRLAFI